MIPKEDIFYFSAIPYSQEGIKDVLLAGIISPRINSILFEGDEEIVKTLALSLSVLAPDVEVIDGCAFKCSLENRSDLCSDCSEKYYGNKELKIKVIQPEILTVDRKTPSAELEKVINALPGFRGIILLERVSELEPGFLQKLLDHPLFLASPLQKGKFKVFALLPEDAPPLPEAIREKFKLIFNQYALTREIEDEELLKRIKAFGEEKEKFQELWQKENIEIGENVQRVRETLDDVYLSAELIGDAKMVLHRHVRKLHYADRIFMELATALSALRKKVASLEFFEQAAKLIVPEKAEPRKKKKAKEIDLRTTISLRGISTLVKKKGAVQSLLEAELARQKEVKAAPPRGETILPTPERKVEPPSVKVEQKPLAVPPPLPAVEVTPSPAIQKEEVKAEVLPEVMPEPEKVPKERVPAEVIGAAPAPAQVAEAVKPVEMKPAEPVPAAKERLPLTMVLVFDASENHWITRIRELMGEVLQNLSQKYVFNAAVAFFRERDAFVLIPPTKEMVKVKDLLTQMPVGGKAPLAAGILKGKDLAIEAKKIFPEDRPLLIIFTDGRANVSTSTLSPSEAAKAACRELPAAGITTIFVDLEAGFLRFGFAEELSKAAKGRSFHVEELEYKFLEDYFTDLLLKEAKEKSVKK